MGTFEGGNNNNLFGKRTTIGEKFFNSQVIRAEDMCIMKTLPPAEILPNYFAQIG